MPPIITIDPSPIPGYIDVHRSTHSLTTLLHNDQLILIEIQGTLEYNLTNPEGTSIIKLGDISWDDTVYLHWYVLIVGVESVFTYWTSQDGGQTTNSENTPGGSHGCTKSLTIFQRRQRMGNPHSNTEETCVRYTPRASVSRRIVMGKIKN
jgi:hypothetical protein